jgi:hypothetical protein
MENWLSRNVPGYSMLSQEEIGALKTFSLLWSFFENYVLETNANVTSIQNKITQLHTKGLLDINDFKEYLDYFIQRYTENTSLNSRFEYLNLRSNDNRSLVQNVLLGQITDTIEVVSAMLIIVFRYRNNFFHGLKWEYEFKDQLQNFSIANSLICKIIELNKSL